MYTNEEANKDREFEFCRSFMGKCCGTGGAEEKDQKFNFPGCEQMMNQFCGTKDGKPDFEACRSKMEQFCKGTK